MLESSSYTRYRNGNSSALMSHTPEGQPETKPSDKKWPQRNIDSGRQSSREGSHVGEDPLLPGLSVFDVDDRIHNALLEELCADYGVTDGCDIDLLTFDIPTTDHRLVNLPSKPRSIHGQKVLPDDVLKWERPPSAKTCQNLQTTTGSGMLKNSDHNNLLSKAVASPTISSSCEENQSVSVFDDSSDGNTASISNSTNCCDESITDDVKAGVMVASVQKQIDASDISKISNKRESIPTREPGWHECRSDRSPIAAGDNLSSTSSPGAVHVAKKQKVIASGGDLLDDVKESYGFVRGANLYSPATSSAAEYNSSFWPEHKTSVLPSATMTRCTIKPSDVVEGRPALHWNMHVDGSEFNKFGTCSQQFQVCSNDVGRVSHFSNMKQMENESRVRSCSERELNAQRGVTYSYDPRTATSESLKNIKTDFDSNAMAVKSAQHVQDFQQMPGAPGYRTWNLQLPVSSVNSMCPVAQYPTVNELTMSVPTQERHSNSQQLFHQSESQVCHSFDQGKIWSGTASQMQHGYGNQSGMISNANNSLGHHLHCADFGVRSTRVSTVPNSYCIVQGKSYDSFGYQRPRSVNSSVGGDSDNYAPYVKSDSTASMAQVHSAPSQPSVSTPVKYRVPGEDPAGNCNADIHTMQVGYTLPSSVDSGLSNLPVCPNTGNHASSVPIHLNRIMPSAASNQSYFNRGLSGPLSADQSCRGFVRHLVGEGSGPYRSHALFPLLRDLVIADMNFDSPSFPFPLLAGIPKSFDRLIENYFSSNRQAAASFGIDPSLDGIITDALRYAHSALIDKIQCRKLKDGFVEMPKPSVDNICNQMSQFGQSADTRIITPGLSSDISSGSRLWSSTQYHPDMSATNPVYANMSTRTARNEAVLQHDVSTLDSSRTFGHWDSPSIIQRRYTLQPQPDHTQTQCDYLSSYSDGSDSLVGSEKTNKNKVLPNEAKAIMVEWLRAHQENPYPNDDEKEELMATTKLTISQINYWFTNARRRLLPKWAMLRRNAFEQNANRQQLPVPIQ